MATQTVIDLEDFLPATFTAPELTDEQFLAFCDVFPDAMLEYTEEGEITVMPPADFHSSARRALVVYRLLNWVNSTGRGTVCGPDAGFRLPTHARRSPDASWFENYPVTQERFPVFAPQFVIEVRSPDDRIAKLRDKMQRYIAAGVLLAWLIDPFERTVTIYRPNREPEVLTTLQRSRATDPSKASSSISAESSRNALRFDSRKPRRNAKTRRNPKIPARSVCFLRRVLLIQRRWPVDRSSRPGDAGRRDQHDPDDSG